MLPGRAGQAGVYATVRIDDTAAVADDVVDLGLAEHLVDGHAQRSRHQAKTASPTASPALMMARSRSVVALARLGHGLHHGLQRGREQEGVRHPVALHQRERALGIEAAAGSRRSAAEVERRQQRVHQAAGPGPVGRATRTPSSPAMRNQFWLQTKPGRLPISARCGISAPLGGPVVPLV
jgi:hypothetical protein